MQRVPDVELLLEQLGLRQPLRALLTETKGCYLVGGALRDYLSGRTVRDLDFVVAGDPTPLARRLGKVLEGSWFWLDRERGHSRVVVPECAERIVCDFAPLQGGSIEVDLSRRDFTVNAMAYDLGLDGPGFLDPLDGRGDLARGILRPCRPLAFLDDPLRVLRGVRFGLTFTLNPSDDTRELMRQASGGLERVAGERLLGELALILGGPACSRGVRQLSEIGALEAVLGCCKEGEEVLSTLYSHLVSWDAGLTLQSPAPSGLQMTVAGGLSRLSLARLGLILRHLVPEDALGAIFERLRLPVRCRKVLCLLVELLGQPIAWPEDWPSGERARVRRLLDWPPDPLAVLWLQWLRRGCREEDLATVSAMEALLGKLAPEGTMPDLVTGDWLQNKLGLAPGPELGRRLESLRQEERSGRVETVSQARNYFLEKVGIGVDKKRG